MSYIECKNVSKSYKDKAVLSNINLSISEPGIYGILGRNGSGKTTLFNMLSPIFKADSGEIQVLGSNPWKIQEQLLSEMGYLADDDLWPKALSFQDLLNLSHQFKKTWDKNLEQKLVKDFELDVTQAVKNMSKGQKQMAGLVLAVCHRPKLLIMDEPGAGLDVVIRRRMFNSLVELIEEQEICIVFASHILDDVERMVDHIFILHDHQIVAQGEVSHFMEHHCQILLEGQESIDHPELISQKDKDGNTLVTFKLPEQTAKEFLQEKAIIQSRCLSLEEIFITYTS